MIAELRAYNFLVPFAASAECPRILHNVLTDVKNHAADEIVLRCALCVCILFSCFASKSTSPTDSFDIISPRVLP